MYLLILSVKYIISSDIKLHQDGFLFGLSGLWGVEKHMNLNKGDRKTTPDKMNALTRICEDLTP